MTPPVLKGSPFQADPHGTNGFASAEFLNSSKAGIAEGSLVGSLAESLAKSLAEESENSTSNFSLSFGQEASKSIQVLM